MMYDLATRESRYQFGFFRLKWKQKAELVTVIWLVYADENEPSTMMFIWFSEM